MEATRGHSEIGNGAGTKRRGTKVNRKTVRLRSHSKLTHQPGVTGDTRQPGRYGSRNSYRVCNMPAYSPVSHKGIPVTRPEEIPARIDYRIERRLSIGSGDSARGNGTTTDLDVGIRKPVRVLRYIERESG